MYLLCATIKAPASKVPELSGALRRLGVADISVEAVSRTRFLEESRLNYDCVFPALWNAEEEVRYLHFSFPDSEAGRDAAYRVEFNLPQIPLNLRYDIVEEAP